MTVPSATPDIMESRAPQARGLRTILPDSPLRMVRELVRALLVFPTFKRATVTPSMRPSLLECKPPPAPRLRTAPSDFPMRMVRLLVRGLLFLSILTGALVLASATLPSLLGLKSMVVSSGSMAPTIGAGVLLIGVPLIILMAPKVRGLLRP